MRFLVEEPPRLNVASLVLSHVPFLILVMLFPVVYWCDKREVKTSHLHLVSKKTSFRKNFYSNDFENSIRKLNESRVEERL